MDAYLNLASGACGGVGTPFQPTWCLDWQMQIVILS
jgi:hypothetical protein